MQYGKKFFSVVLAGCIIANLGMSSFQNVSAMKRGHDQISSGQGEPEQ